jgi:Complex 1 protein (LYR family)
MPPRIWIPKAPTDPLKHLTTGTRRAEALSLYREILRTAKHFHWADTTSAGSSAGAAGSAAAGGTGEPWNRRLRQQARAEFEQAREETDPLVLARLLVTGRDCVQQVQNRFNAATQAAWQRIERDNVVHNNSNNNSNSPSVDPNKPR